MITSTQTQAYRPRGRVVTLNFHGIGTPRRAFEPGEERFWITEQTFQDVLSVAMEHSRPVEITFDDSNASDFDIGLTEISKRGHRARFFVITDRIDTPGSLSTGQLAEMADAGMLFGTHGASHRPWPELADSGELARELDTSVERLQQITGTQISHAAFPRGLYNRAVLTELRHRRFERAYSVDEGWSKPNAWLRTRYSVIHSDTYESVAALLDSPLRTSDPWPLRPIKQAVKRWR